MVNRWKEGNEEGKSSGERRGTRRGESSRERARDRAGDRRRERGGEGGGAWTNSQRKPLSLKRGRQMGSHDSSSRKEEEDATVLITSNMS